MVQRMGIYRKFSALALTTAATMAAVAPVWAAAYKEPLRLTPNSKWILNYADDSCRLLRGFGNGDNSSAFYIERYGPGDSFAMMAAGEPFKKLSRRDLVLVRFGPEEGNQEPNFFEGDFGEFGAALIFSGLSIERPEWTGLSESERKAYFKAMAGRDDDTDPVGEAREKAITWLSFSDGKKQTVRLELGSMGKPFSALRTCTDKLVTSWGVDPLKLASQSRELEPATSPGEWLDSSDYPTSMLRRGQQGLVQFRLSVGEDGKPTGCHIQQSTRPQEFDDIVCKRLMQRAAFIPALDADGKPFPSYYRSAVRFQMPD